MVNNPLIAAGLQGTGVGIKIDRPIASDLTVGKYITVGVAYTFTTFTSSVSFPFFGRMGLPTYYRLTYQVGMPIRKQTTP